jgi:predicted transcriptional regulator
MKEPSVPDIDAAAQILQAPLSYSVHPLCAAYPDYTPEALVEQAADIKAHGLRDSIALTPDGLLLDGKNRVRACMLAGVEIPSNKIEVCDGDPLAFVLSKNEHRRHMTEKQRRAVRARLAAYAAEMALPLGANQHTQGLATAKPSKEVAKATGIPPQDISYIRTIQRHGTSEEKAAVFSGDAPLRGTSANARARAKPRAQSTDPYAEVSKALKTANGDDVARELVAKCSGPEWRTVEELASIVGRKKDEVTEALKRLKADGLVEHQKSADGVALEYRIDDEPARFAPAGLQRKLEFANARVRELEQLLRERDAQLREKDAQLREKDAKLRERDDEIAQLRAKPSSSVEQMERFEGEEAEQAAPSKETIH